MKKLLIIVLSIVLGYAFAFPVKAQDQTKASYTYGGYVGEFVRIDFPYSTDNLSRVDWYSPCTSITPRDYWHWDCEVQINKYFETTETVYCQYRYGDGHSGTAQFSIQCYRVILYLDPTDIVIKKGDQRQIHYSTYPSGKRPSIDWQTDDYSVASVSGGNVYGKSIGKTTIRAEQNMGPTAVCNVTVEAPDPESVSIYPLRAEMNVGDNLRLEATVKPSDADKTLDWYVYWTDTYGAVSVSSYGEVHANRAGSARVAARTVNGKEAYCDITVKSEPSSVEIRPSELSLEPGDGYSLSAYVYPNDAETDLSWSSSNSSVASVSQYGYVSANKTGTAYITVKTSNGCSDECKVTVASEPKSISLSKTSASIKVNETLQLTATVSPSSASTDLSWSSNSTGIATVSQNGLVKGVGTGKATITVSTSNGKKATCEVTVSNVEPNSIKLSKSSASIKVDETLQLNATLSPSNATTTLSWKSSDPKIATVSNSGLVSGKAAGKATISVETSNGKKASCEVTVNNVEPTSIKLSKSSATIYVDETLKLTATITPNNATSDLTWSSSMPKIATVSKDGEVKGIGVGKTTITVTTSNKKKASCEVTVGIRPEAIDIPETLTVAQGSKKNIDVSIFPKGAVTTLTWSSSDSDIASVSSDGEVSGLKTGRATITVKTANGLSAKCVVTVSEPVEPKTVTLNKTKAKVSVGYYIKLECALTPEEASTVYTWESSDEEIATVTSYGFVKGVKEGKATITVTTSNGLTAEATINVEEVPEDADTSKVGDIIKNLKTLAENAVEYLQ